MKRFLITFVFVITLFVLQGTWFDAISFNGISPNLLLILTVSLGLLRGKKTGLLVGFFSGLLLDIFIGSFIGFYAMMYMYLGFFGGLFSLIFYPEDVKLPVITIAVSNIIYGFLCYVFFFLLKGKLDIGYYMVHVTLPETIYTTVVTILIYPLLFVINRALERSERKQARKFV